MYNSKIKHIASLILTGFLTKKHVLLVTTVTKNVLNA